MIRPDTCPHSASGLCCCSSTTVKHFSTLLSATPSPTCSELLLHRSRPSFRLAATTLPSRTAASRARYAGAEAVSSCNPSLATAICSGSDYLAAGLSRCRHGVCSCSISRNCEHSPTGRSCCTYRSLCLTHVRVAMIGRRHKGLLDRSRRGPAEQVPHRAGLVIRSRRAAAAERLLSDDSAGRLVIDVEVAGGETQRQADRRCRRT